MKKNVTNADCITFTVKDNSGEVISELESKLPTALEACGLLAERYAKQLCPVDTGNLRNSITHQQKDNDEYIGTDVFYGKYVELSHILPSGAHTAPQPFLKPAIENHVDEYKAIVKKYLSK